MAVLVDLIGGQVLIPPAMGVGPEWDTFLRSRGYPLGNDDNVAERGGRT
jgi:hypothetical protein